MDTIISFVLIMLRDRLFWHHKARTLTSSLKAVSSLSVSRPTTVVSAANLMMVLESCLDMQLWVTREYRRGLSTHP